MTNILIGVKVTAPLMLEDNLIGVCAECGDSVQYRPHAPPSRKLCTGCFTEAINRQVGAAKVEIYTTEAMLRDVANYLHKRKH
jgi:hypothetical protein